MRQRLVALLSVITPDCDEAFCEQIIAEMKGMLFNYLAPILTGTPSSHAR